MLQIILAILLLIPTLCHAQGTRMTNGAAATSGASILTGITEEPPASGEEDLGASGIFACSWEDGSDELNTGAGTGHVWDSQVQTSDFLTQGTTAGNGFSGDQDKYLSLTGTVNSLEYLIEDITDAGAFSFRFGFYLTTGFASDTSVTIFMGRHDASTEGLTYIQYRRITGNHYLRYYILNSSGVAAQVGADIQIATGTWYQIRGNYQKNIAGDGAGAGAMFEVQNASGHVSGSPQYLAGGTTVRNRDISHIRAGALTNPSAAVTLRMDVLKADSSYTLPDLKAW